ncbi:MAG: hypothetical protein A2W17_11235 [Planctomycetes bacterium RBG_16_41_13]|nr:MAG: hypothetical protein A2W17_11235 [Planctomycetes bacterium RBG_16_41_13]
MVWKEQDGLLFIEYTFQYKCSCKVEKKSNTKYSGTYKAGNGAKGEIILKIKDNREQGIKVKSTTSGCSGSHKDGEGYVEKQYRSSGRAKLVEVFFKRLRCYKENEAHKQLEKVESLIKV